MISCAITSFVRSFIRSFIHSFIHSFALAQSKLDEKEGKAAEIYDTFRAFKQQIALQAVNSRSGKGLSKKEIEAFTSDERARDDELSKVRLRNTTLRMALKKLELLLKAKDELAEGLHVVDYEQLKIENATLVFYWKTIARHSIRDTTTPTAGLRRHPTLLAFLDSSLFLATY